MRRVCTICARGGSKGVKDKNIRELLGRPLIAYSLEQARQSGLFEVIAVSSDAAAIRDAAVTWGATMVIGRPDDLATDLAAKVPAIRHCVTEVERRAGLEFDTVVDLDATSPLRTVEDIVGSVALLERRGVSNVITGAPARRSPYFNLVELDGDGYVHLSKKLDRPIVRRQDAPKCYDMNASIYVWSRQAFLAGAGVFNDDTLLFEMPEERSVDIDTEWDFELVQLLMQRRSLKSLQVDRS